MCTRNKYDYQTIVREATRQLSTMLELQPLLCTQQGDPKNFQRQNDLVYLTDETERTFLPFPTPKLFLEFRHVAGGLVSNIATCRLCSV